MTKYQAEPCQLEFPLPRIPASRYHVEDFQTVKLIFNSSKKVFNTTNNAENEICVMVTILSTELEGGKCNVLYECKHHTFTRQKRDGPA